ncbi:DUF2288 domain-containing protein [Arenicella xantha]|uniref:DUF2288 family protein n=1 Tax=Arenicella xantha TaxID=644221 RepID=A0A395JK52_9GAMM|nr:DUF2288 domain-containing protein [Arenicella xantha]RBP50909.1 hypothetical protein DFR28_102325 [Arenicella xantha]
MNINEAQSNLVAKLHSETAHCAWRELQRFFAQGKVLVVDPSLDLVSIGVSIAEDDAATLKPLIDAAKISAPSSDLARKWYQDDAELWTLVVAPYVLVQDASREA